jgi:hypothetical protein
MTAINRPCSAANLDPANDNITYDAAFDVRELVSVEEVMEREELGPNGGVLWAMEELEANFEWLEEHLNECGECFVNPFTVYVLTMCRRDNTIRSAWTAGTHNTSHGIAAHISEIREAWLSSTFRP